MDRNREGRRASNMAAPPANGISRRRHRSNSLRDSPDEDGGTEVHEGGRLRERGVANMQRMVVTALQTVYNHGVILRCTPAGHLFPLSSFRASRFRNGNVT
ncbi:protein TIME FOR COFFEE [Artemisia annua]|uniref:Protein TIME FOR COFFEE n=1 Tax=Artemisia annua TaxID=35608 RepID=A0A2U1M3T0_ARTAN|nr:protein TIME FOR COFFEE [Artemisia annua]